MSCSKANTLLGSVGARHLYSSADPFPPVKLRRRKADLVTEVPFSFLLCTPSQLAPPHFLPIAGREMPVGLGFPSAEGPALGLTPDLSVSLGQAWGKPNTQEIGTTKNSQLFLWPQSIMTNLRKRDKNGIAPLRGRE